MHLIDLLHLRLQDVHAIWALADAACQAQGQGAGSAAGKVSGQMAQPSLAGTVAWSFEGNGIRTRTSFIQAFSALGMSFIELPNLLNTAERVEDLAGYLDPFYAAYVIRAGDHTRLAAFAAASRRPVVNAMSGQGHPCEVLTDAYFIDRSVAPITQARICLWGPTTNVLRSWHGLAQVLGLHITHVCPAAWHADLPGVRFVERVQDVQGADIVITDGWPAAGAGGAEGCQGLTLADLERLGQPLLLPTPPFSIGRELALDPLHYPRFVGYGQKALLLPVQQAILQWALGS